MKVKNWKETAEDRRTSSPQSTGANTDQRMSNLFRIEVRLLPAFTAAPTPGTSACPQQQLMQCRVLGDFPFGNDRSATLGRLRHRCTLFPTRSEFRLCTSILIRGHRSHTFRGIAATCPDIHVTQFALQLI